MTRYGHALALKLWLFAWVLAFGGVQPHPAAAPARRVKEYAAVTRASQTLALTDTGELAFGLLVVAATSWLVGLPRTR